MMKTYYNKVLESLIPNEKNQRKCSLLEYLIFNGPLLFLARCVDESQDEI